MEWDLGKLVVSVRSEPSVSVCTVRLGILACCWNPCLPQRAEKGDRLQFVKRLGTCQELGSQKSLYRTRGP